MANSFDSSQHGSLNWGADRIRRLLDQEEREKRDRLGLADGQEQPGRQRGLLAGPPTLNQKVQSMFGFDPAIRRRGSVLPIGMDEAGNTYFAWPQFAYDMARSFLLPGHVVEGGKWDADDAREMALDYGLLGAGAGVAKAPRGALGMGAGGRRSSFTLDYYGQSIRVLQNPSAKELEGFLGRTKYRAVRRPTPRPATCLSGMPPTQRCMPWSPRNLESTRTPPRPTSSVLIRG